MYRYRDVETDLCLTCVSCPPTSSSPPLPPLFLHCHPLQSDSLSSTSQPLMLLEDMLGRCNIWRTSTNKCNATHTHTHWLSPCSHKNIYLLYETLDMENIMFWSSCPAHEVGLYAVSTTDSLEMRHYTSRILLVWLSDIQSLFSTLERTYQHATLVPRTQCNTVDLNLIPNLTSSVSGWILDQKFCNKCNFPWSCIHWYKWLTCEHHGRPDDNSTDYAHTYIHF